jgi:hypothetical protein
MPARLLAPDRFRPLSRQHPGGDAGDGRLAGNGDPLMAVACEHSDAGNASAFATDLEIAHDYRTYVDNSPVINALMAAEPDSAFTAGWTITLLRAQALGLNAPLTGTPATTTCRAMPATTTSSMPAPATTP